MSTETERRLVEVQPRHKRISSSKPFPIAEDDVVHGSTPPGSSHSLVVDVNESGLKGPDGRTLPFSHSIGSSFRNLTSNPTQHTRGDASSYSLSTTDPCSSGNLSHVNTRSAFGMRLRSFSQEANKHNASYTGSPGVLPQHHPPGVKSSAKPPKSPALGPSTPDRTKQMYGTRRSGSQSSTTSSTSKSPRRVFRDRNHSSIDEGDAVVQVWKSSDDLLQTDAFRKAEARQQSEMSRDVHESESMRLKNINIQNEGSYDTSSLLLDQAKQSHTASGPEELRATCGDILSVDDDRSRLDGTPETDQDWKCGLIPPTLQREHIDENSSIRKTALWLLCCILFAQYLLQSFLLESDSLVPLKAIVFPLAQCVLAYLGTLQKVKGKARKVITLANIGVFLGYHVLSIFPSPGIFDGNVMPLIVLIPFILDSDFVAITSAEVFTFGGTLLGQFVSINSDYSTGLDNSTLVQIVTVAMLVLSITIGEYQRLWVNSKSSSGNLDKLEKIAFAKSNTPGEKESYQRKFLEAGFGRKWNGSLTRGDKSGSQSSENGFMPPGEFDVVPLLGGIKQRPTRSQSMSTNIGHDRSTTVSRMQRAYMNLAHSTSELMKHLKSLIGQPAEQASIERDGNPAPPGQEMSKEVKKAMRGAQRELCVARMLGVNLPRRDFGRDRKRYDENDEAMRHIINMIHPERTATGKRKSDAFQPKTVTSGGRTSISNSDTESAHVREPASDTIGSSTLQSSPSAHLAASNGTLLNMSRCKLFHIPIVQDRPRKEKLRRASVTGVRETLNKNVMRRRVRSFSDLRRIRSLLGSNNKEENSRILNTEKPRFFRFTACLTLGNIRSSSFDVFQTVRNNFYTRATVFASIKRPDQLRFPFEDMDKTSFHLAQPLVAVMGKIYQENLRSFENLGISRDKYLQYFEKIEQGYQASPYHNKFHGADVAATMYRLAFNSQIWRWIKPLERIALVTAAAVHDTDHPGVNNTFLINTEDPIAVRYNDKSPLESHHVATAFALLKSRSDCHMLQHLPQEDYFEFRRTVVELVLVTDLSCHVQFIDEYRDMLARNEPSSGESAAANGSGSPEGTIRTVSSGSLTSFSSFRQDDVGCKHSTLEEAYTCTSCYRFLYSLEKLGEMVQAGFSSKKDQMLLWKLMIKTADVAHAAKPMELHLKWSQRIVEEMFRQGDMEKEMDMPVSPLMNRDKIDGLATSQIGFIDFICLPLFQSWDAVALASVTYTAHSRRRTEEDDGSARTQKEIHELALDRVNVGESDLFMAPLAVQNREQWCKADKSRTNQKQVGQ